MGDALHLPATDPLGPVVLLGVWLVAMVSQGELTTFAAYPACEGSLSKRRGQGASSQARRTN